jgi:hypothetical protein
MNYGSTPRLQRGPLAPPNPARGALARQQHPPAHAESWLHYDENNRATDPAPTVGALRLDPETLERLVNFLRTSLHTGVGGARQALSRDMYGINEAAVEAAVNQADDHVIGMHGLRGGWRA